LKMAGVECSQNQTAGFRGCGDQEIKIGRRESFPATRGFHSGERFCHRCVNWKDWNAVFEQLLEETLEPMRPFQFQPIEQFRLTNYGGANNRIAQCPPTSLDCGQRLRLQWLTVNRSVQQMGNRHEASGLIAQRMVPHLFPALWKWKIFAYLPMPLLVCRPSIPNRSRLGLCSINRLDLYEGFAPPCYDDRHAFVRHLRADFGEFRLRFEQPYFMHTATYQTSICLQEASHFRRARSQGPILFTPRHSRENRAFPVAFPRWHSSRQSIIHHPSSIIDKHLCASTPLNLRFSKICSFPSRRKWA
jgi:hypothetical protein